MLNLLASIKSKLIFNFVHIYALYTEQRGGGDFDTLGQDLLNAITSTFFDGMTRFLAWWLIFSRSTPIFSEIEDWRSFEVT